MKKKIFALLLAMAMTFGMSATVFASGATGNVPGPVVAQITVTGLTNATEVHTYEAYQIFVGDVVEDVNGVKTLSNVKWGDNVPSRSVTYKGTTYTDAAELAEALSNETDARDFANAVVLAGNPVATQTEASAGAGVVFTVQTGYYLIKDQDGSLDGDFDSYSRYMVQVAGNSTVAAKADVPSTLKKIKDVNDSTGVVSDWQDSADYDIGDKIPYQFSATVAKNADLYVNPYIFTFYDEASGGLTYNKDSVVVKVDGTDITSKSTVTVNGQKLSIVTPDLRDYAGKTVTVEYTCTLNEYAVIGAAGNPNTMYLEYSNNPNGDGTGKTPIDKCIAFTYKVLVNKVDQDGKALSGAEFLLEKYNKATNEWEAKAQVTATPDTVFQFDGLDDGEYRLSETKTPGGYNTIPDQYVYFTVVANHDVTSDDPKLIDLTGNVQTGLTGTYAFAADVTQGSLITNIENQTGAILPSTGGIGTTIFYVLGAILIVGGGAMLFVKGRMNKEND